MRLFNFLVLGGFGAAVAIGCGGDSSGSGPTPAQRLCTDICTNCVVPANPQIKLQDCQSHCAAVAAAADPVAECQSEVTAQGVSQCASRCPDFANLNKPPASQSSCYVSDSTKVECTSTPDKPKKLDCTDTSAQSQYMAQGCVPEKPGDKDLCCPSTVIAPPKPQGSGGSGGGNNVGGSGNVGGSDVGGGGNIGGSGNVGGSDVGGGGNIGGSGGAGSCDATWLGDCTTNADCSCDFTCVQVCSACKPNCGHNCATDADCVGQMVGILPTPYCFTLNNGYDGWCSSNAN